MLTSKHDFLLQFRVLDLVVFNENILSNNLDCVQFLILIKFSQKDFTKSTLAKDDEHFEIG